jgi:CRISPR-associated protein Csd1
VELQGSPQEAKQKKKAKQSAGEAAAPDKEQMPPLAVFRLACTTVREAKDLQSEVATQLYRAAMEGGKPSVSLVKPILHRLQADIQKFGMKTLLNVSRFSLLRLILNRNRKEGEPMIESQVFETDDAAYNCGRLLAVLAEIQAKAHDFKLEGPGVAERYFGVASVSPSSVFSLLLRLNRHHLDKVGKSPKYASHRRPLEETIQAICAKFTPSEAGKPPDFPRVLDLQSQGRFALGFYQQKADSDARRAEARKDKAARDSQQDVQ